MARYNSKRKQSSTAIFLSIIAILSIMLVGLSFAYFTDHKELSNTLSFGKLAVSVNGAAGTTSTKVFVFGNGSSENNGLLNGGDTIDFKGTVGLEDNSISAYIRIKLDNFKYYTSASKTTEAAIKPSNNDKKTFISNFLTAVADSTKASSGTQQDWTYINNYLYYGKMMSSSNAYSFDKSIEVTEDLVPTSFQGLTVQFDLVIQAIQAGGAVDSNGTKISDSVTALTPPTTVTANTVASATMWASVFPEPAEPLTGSLSGILKVGVLDEEQKTAIVGADTNCPNEYVIPAYVKKVTSGSTTTWYSSSDNFNGQENNAGIYKVTKISGKLYASGSNYYEDWEEGGSKFPSGLTKVAMPETIIEIGLHTFNACSNLKSVTMSKNITIIDNGAFFSCSSLTSIDISVKVTSIGFAAFGSCSSLKTIYYEGTQEQWTSLSKSTNSVPSGVKVICSNGTITIS